MFFNSVDFMFFFPIILVVYFLIPKKGRCFWLLITSYYFYMNWNVGYALLLAMTTIITYFSGILIEEESKNQNRLFYKKAVLILSIVSNLGILVHYKYSDFLITIVNALTQKIGVTAVERSFDIILPMGISFYTLQALGYVIDVYRENIEAEQNFFDYALFISFFPKLISGPIEHSKNILKQIHGLDNIALFNLKRICSGCILMVWGYFLKMVISDRVAILVNTVFDNYYMYGNVELCVAAIAYALQIYCDFSSYSTIAVGAAQIMGVSLMENFNTPYFATNIKDFWRRWHISLSTWLRDYIYIPLGGNRHGKVKKAINLFLTFAVSGIWHGANWTYIIWGCMHGIYQIISDCTFSLRTSTKKYLKVKTDCFSYRLFQRIVTFVMVDAAWIVFRSNTISDALNYFKRIFTVPSAWILFNGGLFSLGLDHIEMNILFISVILLLLVDSIRSKKKLTIDAFILQQNLLFAWAWTIGLICIIFIYGMYGPNIDSQSFIYFQF